MDFDSLRSVLPRPGLAQKIRQQARRTHHPDRATTGFRVQVWGVGSGAKDLGFRV